MPKTVAVTLNGTEWHMPISFRASEEFADAVGDPLQMVLNVKDGIFELSLKDVVNAIYIGCKAAGCSLSRDQVGQYVIDQGVAAFVEPVGRYICAMVEGGPSKPVEPSDGSKKKRPRGSG